MQPLEEAERTRSGFRLRLRRRLLKQIRCALRHPPPPSPPSPPNPPGQFRRPAAPQIPFEQIKPDYLLGGCFRWSFASASTPAGCLLQLIHGLDESARDAKSQSENCNKQSAVSFITRLLF
jgi:hypothetical protein